jgi:hypothetical protein
VRDLVGIVSANAVIPNCVPINLFGGAGSFSSALRATRKG